MAQGVLARNITSAVCAFGVAFSGVGYSSTVPVHSTNASTHSQARPVVDRYSTNTRRASLMNTKESYYYRKTYDTALSLEAKGLFGAMREATIEETESVSRYIRGISKDTGVNFFELC